MVRERRIPLTLSYPEPNDDSLASIKVAEEAIAQGGKGYSNAKEMLESIGL